MLESSAVQMSTTNRGRKRRAPTESSDQSEMNENLSADDGMSVPGTATYDENLSQISGGKRRRKKFTPTQRAHVAQVRKAGACLECRARKVKCSHALLPGADANPQSDTASAARPSPQHTFFGFETTFEEIVYPGPSWEGDAMQWTQSDDAQHQDPSFIEGADLIASVPASTIRQERLALEIDDIHNIIEDDFGGSASRSGPNIPEWGHKSQWMRNATILPNSQQYSEPSNTTYTFSNTNCSVDGRALSSTPASSNEGLLSSYTQEAGHYLCDVRGCDDARIFTEAIHLRHHQETKHADILSRRFTHTCKAVGCSKRYATLERLQMHITCIHPKTLETPTQLPSSGMYEIDMGSAKLAQVNEFVSGQYLAGMEDDLMAMPDRSASGANHSRKGDNWHQERALQQRAHRNADMGSSASPLQRQSSTRSAEESVRKTRRQISFAGSNHEIGSTVTNSTALLPVQDQHAMEQMSNFTVQHGIPQSYPHRTSSPTPSFIGYFGNGMHISEQGEIEGGYGGGIFARTTSGLLAPSTVYTPEDQQMMAFNEQMLNSNDNRQPTRLGNNVQLSYNGLDLNEPIWLGQDSLTPSTQTGVFHGDYNPAGFQPDVFVVRYSGNDEPLPSFPVSPSHPEQPMFMLNDKPIQNPGIPFVLDNLALDRVMSQTDSAPQLEYNTSTMSSSVASDSVLSLADAQAPNPLTGKYGDEWEMSVFNPIDETM